MVASYLLSSTLVPVLAIGCCGRSMRAHSAKRAFFDRFRDAYGKFSGGSCGYAGCRAAYLLIAGGSSFLSPSAGGRFSRSWTPASLRCGCAHPLGAESSRPRRLRSYAGRYRQRGRSKNVDITLGSSASKPAYPINTIYLWTSGSEEPCSRYSSSPRAREGRRASGTGCGRNCEGTAGVRFSFEPSTSSPGDELRLAHAVELAVSGRCCERPRVRRKAEERLRSAEPARPGLRAGAGLPRGESGDGPPSARGVMV